MKTKTNVRAGIGSTTSGAGAGKVTFGALNIGSTTGGAGAGK